MRKRFRRAVLLDALDSMILAAQRKKTEKNLRD